ncbi:MAG: ferredoxin [Verrucomicrobia bacterium]|nr:ferredoxin [Verrucomicrobiota bacterium]
MMSVDGKNGQQSRRSFVTMWVRGLLALAVGAVAGFSWRKARRDNLVWQLNPNKCVQCGRCATECVLTPSAVKCIHAYDICGYCKLCGGYHQPKVKVTDTAAENQLCPVGAIKRTYVEDPYYEYTIDEALCIGCGKCVKGCGSFGNGSLFMQVRHDRCVNCNQCAIAKACPANAYVRVPAEHPYLLKSQPAMPEKKV